MTQPDESLEVGIAAGLDAPTALALSQEPQPARRPRSDRTLAWAAIIGSVVLMLLWWLAHCRVSHSFHPPHPRLRSPAARTTDRLVSKREFDPPPTIGTDQQSGTARQTRQAGVGKPGKAAVTTLPTSLVASQKTVDSRCRIWQTALRDVADSIQLGGDGVQCRPSRSAILDRVYHVGIVDGCLGFG